MHKPARQQGRYVQLKDLTSARVSPSFTVGLVHVWWAFAGAPTMIYFG
jgi:hypothetical protein